MGAADDAAMLVAQMGVDPSLPVVRSIGKYVVPEALTPAAQTELNTLAYKGWQHSTQDPRVAAARALIPQSQQFMLGFDAGIQTSWGTLIPGSGQDRIKRLLSPAAGGTQESLSGFMIGQAVAWGISKQNIAGTATSPDPTFAAGQSIALGLAGSGLSPDQKAAIMATAAADPTARAGAANGIAQAAADQNKGIFTKILEFFGLA